jgi:hypothetical protein
MIRFRCPACAKALKVPEELAGKKVTCPHCHDQARVPEARPEPRAEVPDPAPGFLPSMSPRLRTAVAVLAAAGGLGLLAAVLGGAWVAHGGMVLAAGSCLALLAVFYGHATGCPRCGGWWSRTKVKTEVADREVFDRGGATFGRSATRTEFRCGGCGHRWTVTDSEEYPVGERSHPGRAGQ